MVCLLLQSDAGRVDVAVKLAGRVFLLRPDGDERAIGQFGERWIADGPAAAFGWAIREERGLAPSFALIV